MQLPMKKMILIISLLIATAMIFGYKQYGLNIIADYSAKQPSGKDIKGIDKPELNGSFVNGENATTKKAPEHRADILRILTNDRSKSDGPSSLLWNLLNPDSAQTGC